jgi:hypothetical protein
MQKQTSDWKHATEYITQCCQELKSIMWSLQWFKKQTTV